MRIAEIAPPWFALPPEGYGGIEWIVAQLADELTKRGHDVTLFAPPGSKSEARIESPLPAEPPRGSIGDVWYELVHDLAVYERAQEFDIIHDHSGAVGPTIGAFSPHGRVVHTLHGPFTDQAKRLYALLARKLWFVAISDSQRRQAPEGLRWAGTVPNGIPLDLYPFQADKEDYVAFLGRVDDEKCPDLAIQAARRAGRSIKMCVKMQEEPERSYWREKVEPLLGDDVEVLGECGTEEKAKLLSGAAATLVPIQWEEPFGLVMVESMACGTPVVAFARGAAPELIVDGQTGYLVDSMDEFVSALDRLDRLDPHAARARVEERFSTAAMVAGYEAAFDRVMAGREEPPG